VAANSHAWVEIYFPNIGWVEFEPTTNLPPVAHPGQVQPPKNPLTDVPTPEPESNGFHFNITWSEVSYPLEIVVGILAGLAILLLLLPVENWLLYLRPADKAVSAIYNRLYRRGHGWGLPADSTRTPREFAAALATRLERMKRKKHLVPVVTALLEDLNWLTGIYNQMLFSPLPLSRDEHHQAVQAWNRIRRGFSRLQR
jgi:hypothetical protein